jgi:homeobox-leucine zipper protein
MIADHYYIYVTCYLLPLCFITPRTFPLLDMELELSLGDSLAPAKHTNTHALAPTRTGKGEGHDLALGLGVTPDEGSEQDSQRKSPRREDTVVLEDDEACPQVELPVEASLSCTLNLVSAQTSKFKRIF